MDKNISLELSTLENMDNEQEALNEKKAKREKAKQRKQILESITQLNAELQRSNSARHVDNHAASSISTDIGPRSSLKFANGTTLDFTKTGRKVKLVHYLGHLKNGSIAYSGVDTTSGQLFYVTEWQLKKSQIKQKCTKNGRYLWANSATTDCKSIGVDNLIARIEEQVANLTLLKHKNLVHYECVLCVKHKRSLTIFLVQEFVCGESLSAMSAGGLVDWSIDGTRRVAKAVLRVLVYLHEKGFLYGHLLNNTVLFDNSRNIRCTNYSVVSILKDLIDHSSSGTTKMSIQNDLIDLGKLVKSLITTKFDEVHDFIESCNIASFSSELLLHPFVNFPSDQPFSSGISRFHTEYEMLMYLGSGAFGDVRKVRSTLDNRIYAIKRIPLIASPQLFKKMTREIELLSYLKHENIVRYYSSWTENAQNKDMLEIKAAFSHIWSLDQSSEDNSTERNSSSSIKFDNFNKDETFYDEKNETSANEATTRISYMHILHIQMEFCDKRTLRNAIEENLSDNSERVWHLFNGIQQGISHIHQHGIIHRDLKPENIFLDFKGDIKIGDFGMATKEFCMKKRPSMSSDITNFTGKVGTSLYVAPELLGNAFESYYNHKVDMYAFGIILFEMIHPTFTTIMERVKVLSALRSSDVVIPVSLLNNCKYDEIIKIIDLLLNHDPSHRPDTNHTKFLLLRQAALLQIISLKAKKLSE